MTAAANSNPLMSTRSRWNDLVRSGAGPRGAATAHYASLVLAAVILVVLTRGQWFFFDEWAFVQDGWDELWTPHVGHWSTVAIGVWGALQAVFGLNSYGPFILVAILVHLLTAHLLWRLIRRTGGAPWVATALAGLFMVLGAASENLLWAFQYAYMGAIACGLGAVLLSLGPRLTIGRQFAIAALMIVGEATSGTLLPFYIPVALIVWRAHGWRKLVLTVAVPALVYLVWYAVVGVHVTNVLRATGIDLLYTPVFAGAMVVDSIGKIIPLPYVGAVVVAVIGLAIVVILRRRLDLATYAALGVLGAGVAFSMLTAYSRWETGIVSASSGRYVYMMFVVLAPIAGNLITRVIGRSRASLWVAMSAIVVVGVYNVGLLASAARAEAARENETQQIVSVGLEMQDRYPTEVDDTLSPDLEYVRDVDLADLRTLVETEGLQTTGYDRPAWLTAVASVGLSWTDAMQRASCTRLAVGDAIPAGSVIGSDGIAAVTLVAVDPDGTRGNGRMLALDDDDYRTLTTVEDTDLAVAGIDGEVRICRAASGEADD